jgi:hypothetical protein
MPLTKPVLTHEQNVELNNIRENSLYLTVVTPNFPQSVYLEWEITYFPIVEDTIPAYVYSVYRSGSVNGPWTLLNSTPTANTFFLDPAIELFSLDREYYYKVIATSTNLVTPISKESKATSLIADQHGLVHRRYLEFNKIKRDRRIQLFMVNSEVLILKRKHYGERCTDCYDQEINEVLKDKCDTCFGTSFIGGFYNPVRLLVEYREERVQKAVDMHSYAEAIISSLIMQDAPRANKDDIIYEPNFDRMWRIMTIQNSSLNKSPLSQILTIVELARDSIEYRIPINQSSILDLYNRIETFDFLASTMLSKE